MPIRLPGPRPDRARRPPSCRPSGRSPRRPPRPRPGRPAPRPARGPLGGAPASPEPDRAGRRLGLILGVYPGGMVEAIEETPAVARDEVRLHHARALLFAGDPAAARREVVAWGGPKDPPS